MCCMARAAGGGAGGCSWCCRLADGLRGPRHGCRPGALATGLTGSKGCCRAVPRHHSKRRCRWCSRALLVGGRSSSSLHAARDARGVQKSHHGGLPAAELRARHCWPHTLGAPALMQARAWARLAGGWAIVWRDAGQPPTSPYPAQQAIKAGALPPQACDEEKQCQHRCRSPHDAPAVSASTAIPTECRFQTPVNSAISLKIQSTYLIIL